MEEKKKTRSFIKELHPITEMILFAGILHNAYESIMTSLSANLFQNFNDFWYLGFVWAGLDVLMILALIMILISKRQGLYLFFYTEIAVMFTTIGISGGDTDLLIRRIIIVSIQTIILLLSLLLKENGRNGYQILGLAKCPHNR